jgi:D-glycero-D-manno-heptose 1,7-bisphosphate phosphatase
VLSKAVFLDRDGVLNKRLVSDKEDDPANYVLSWQQFEWEDYAISAMQNLIEAGYTIVIVSNQSAIGRGFVSSANIKFIFDKMCEHLMLMNVPVHSIWCPHVPEDNCACRKPKPGMIYKVACELGIDLNRSWLVGDSESDIYAGINSGMPSGRLVKIGEAIDFPCLLASNLHEAVDIILSE